MHHKIVFFTGLAMGFLALGAEAAPAGRKGPDMSDAGIFTSAHLYSFGHDGDGPELAECMITTADYDAFYHNVGDRFATVSNVSLVSYSSYPSKTNMLLAPHTNDAKATDLFIQACRANHGSPYRYP